MIDYESQELVKAGGVQGISIPKVPRIPFPFEREFKVLVKERKKWNNGTRLLFLKWKKIIREKVQVARGSISG